MSSASGVGIKPGSRGRDAGVSTTSGPRVGRRGVLKRCGLLERWCRCGTGERRRGGDRRRYGEGVLRSFLCLVVERWRGSGDRGR